MIFDERDIEKKQDKKNKPIKPEKTQITFDELEIKAEPATEEVLNKEELTEEVEYEEEMIDLEEEQEFDEDGNLHQSLKKVVHDSMIPYSEYVILDRALPRVEDGLKPVQRRILYSMYEIGLTPDKPFRKSAKVVGDCIGSYHPHGDTSVYNAMVRMAQNFNMKQTLVNGHGNFGSMDGDSAAAMRYTESKLQPIALELLKDIEKDTVSWSWNYDDSKKEPDMLPGRYPNLLVNGASGIAVGLATNIPPHNLGETVDGVIAYIENKKITTDEMLKIIKGPDFPMGGIILGTEGIEKAYKTGKGKVVLRAKTSIEKDKTGKPEIIITEFPYQVNKANALQKIVRLKEKNKDLLSDIKDIRDESDRNGVRSVITLKKDANAEKILNYLFKHSDLQVNFSINMVAIAGGKPKLLSLMEIISYYVNYQREVVYNRTKFDLEANEKKVHVLEGLLIAIRNIDEVIKLIKASESTAVAKQELIKRFKLSSVQAQAVLDMRLARLTNLEVEKLTAQVNELHELIKKLKKILASKTMQLTIVKKELLQVKKQYAGKRKTRIIKDISEIKEKMEEEFVAIKDVVLAVNNRNCIKAIPVKNFNLTARLISEKSNLSEVHSHLSLATTDMQALIFSNFGNCYRTDISKISEGKWKDRGMSLKDLLPGYLEDERVVGIIPITNKTFEKQVCMFTKRGMVKVSELKDYDLKKSKTQSIKLKEGDEVLNVVINNNLTNMVFVTANGAVLNAVKTDVPVQSRVSLGVKGINLNEQDSLVFAGIATKEDKIVVVTSKGYCKRVEIQDLDVMSRARKGVKIATLGMDNGFDILFADLEKQPFEIYVVTDKNKIVSLKTPDMPVESRTTKGKIITKAKRALKIKNICKYAWEFGK